MGTYKQLEAWKNSMKLTLVVYQQTNGFPKHEQYGLVSQIRRAAVSVPANISEGAARLNSREFQHFLRISFGSLAELESLLLLANKLGYLKKENHDVLRQMIISSPPSYPDSCGLSRIKSPQTPTRINQVNQVYLVLPGLIWLTCQTCPPAQPVKFVI